LRSGVKRQVAKETVNGTPLRGAERTLNVDRDGRQTRRDAKTSRLHNYKENGDSVNASLRVFARKEADAAKPIRFFGTKRKTAADVRARNRNVDGGRENNVKRRKQTNGD